MNPRETIHEDGMVSMSILGHLEELRMRVIRALMGFGIIYLLCICFSDRLWLIVQAPSAGALMKLGIKHASPSYGSGRRW